MKKQTIFFKRVGKEAVKKLRVFFNRVGKEMTKQRRLPLFAAVVLALVFGASVAVLSWLFLAALLGRAPGQLAPDDLLTLSLYIAAGVGGFVALVVAYRRQDDLEQGRFVERFGAAAAQLGTADPAVRLAGAYAMAVVADESNLAKRQQCIDVLCAYLRLPYSPQVNLDNKSGQNKTSNLRRSTQIEETFVYRLNDREVRQTIINIFASRVHADAERSWSKNDFNFEGAVFDSANFDSAVFGAGAIFERAKFGDVASFYGATFGGGASFHKAKFGDLAWFDEAKFGDGAVFYGASFGGGASFHKAKFGDGAVFDEAKFGDGASFHGASFGGDASFHKASFGDGASFYGVKFGDGASFYGATFGDLASFHVVRFGGGASFHKATFGDGAVFDDAKFGDRAVFYDASFGDVASFDRASFGDWRSFEDATVGRGDDRRPLGDLFK